MSKFNISSMTGTFSKLGEQLASPNDNLLSIIDNEQHYNPWFTPESVLHAVTAIGKMLNTGDLQKWLAKYSIDYNKPAKTIGLILAGNIPLVGFHDILCVLVTGNSALIKASSQDARLVKCVLQMLVEIEPQFSNRYDIVERLERFDAVIATGSNNSSRYFDYYFGKVPNIIRKNRNSIALLTGDETREQLFELGHDIFDYFGLGCRNVSKLIVPRDYNFNVFFESVEPYQPIINHHKYNNNYDYNKTIFLVGQEKHLDNGFLLLKEDARLASPLAVLYYEFYDDLQSAQKQIQSQSGQIQCVVTSTRLDQEEQAVTFGKSQQPDLWDYADGIDTVRFLVNLDK